MDDGFNSFAFKFFNGLLGYCRPKVIADSEGDREANGKGMELNPLKILSSSQSDLIRSKRDDALENQRR